MRRLRRRATYAGVAAVVAMVLCCGVGAARPAQGKGLLLSGVLYRVHAGFLEIKSDEKHIAVVKVDSATVYWNGKTDKAANKKDLNAGDELIIEMAEKNQAMVARKVRFLHREGS